MWMARCAYAAMSASCVTSTIVLPPSCSRSKTPMISLPVFESRLPVGSSASRIDGIVDERARDGHALTLAARQLVRTVRRASVSSTFASASLARSCRDLPGDAAVNERQLDVVKRRRARQQIERLKDEPDLLVPDPRQLVVVHRTRLLCR